MLIVGAGQCGGRAALTLREQGYDGPVTLIGDEPHLPYERPPLSKDVMVSEVEPKPRFIADQKIFIDRKIQCMTGTRAIAIDRRERAVALANSRTLPYEKLLLATGAVPRRLPLPGAEGGRCAYLRTHDDALRIRKVLAADSHVAVLGGGFIGLELAASARKRGARVTVIEALPRILTRGVPDEIADVIDARHRAGGVVLACAKSLSALRENAGGIEITLADGSFISADLLVIGIGAVPVTDLAQEAGLVIDNGIAVDTQLRTSDPNIYAAGDCCSFPVAIYGGRRVRLECWRNAQDQGELAARNMLGAEESASAAPWFWSDQYDLRLQIAGLPEEGRRLVRRDLPDGAFILFHLADDGRLVAASRQRCRKGYSRGGDADRERCDAGSRRIGGTAHHVEVTTDPGKFLSWRSMPQLVRPWQTCGHRPLCCPARLNHL
jgi:3-phenylpropionate/trans-cinnamate dioxygenase ferredoxin reductase subunit